ncbi:mechanosensitive ion channel family protein [Sphingobacterium bovistauri]|uniref:Mechanosensitive ion channel n=1 Tax=Sphingobacterium bovistauri TaxID=2781959 RepID=A0ABS7Z0B3_9SPHI|nr:mechanosensitive ion channel domain-containing protein [Sphingobacterium bovistauri]MCA5003607.1 mechanosensitive ion channel [Sphingobacterium bovistauri]
MTAKEKQKITFPYMFVLKIIAVIITVMVYNTFFESKKSELLSQIFRGVNTFLIPSIVISILRFVIISIYNARHANRSVRGNFVLGINRLTAIINTVLLVIALMVAFGINPIQFVTSLTIVAMAIAVLFRDYITNMLSGLFVMFSEQLSVGDRIKVGEHKGRIVDITFANIILQNEEDDMVMVPNNLVFTNSMVNLSAHRSNLFTVKFELPLSVATDIETLEKEIQSVLINHPNLDENTEPKIHVVDIGKDFVRYKIELYAISSSNKLHREIENEVLREILIFEHSKTKVS